MFNIKFLTVVGLCLVQVACTKNSNTPVGPKDRLAEYVSKSFDVKSIQDRKVLEEYLTGPAKQRLQAWSDDQFEQAFVEVKRKKEKLAFKEIKSVSESEVNITYEVSYTDKGKEHVALVTNRKVSTLVKEGDLWFIKDVKNLRELVEYQDEMSLP